MFHYVNIGAKFLALVVVVARSSQEARNDPEMEKVSKYSHITGLFVEHMAPCAKPEPASLLF